MGKPTQFISVNPGLSFDRPADRPKKVKPATRAGFMRKKGGPDDPEPIINVLKKKYLFF